jgi:hypothetical protein
VSPFIRPLSIRAPAVQALKDAAVQVDSLGAETLSNVSLTLLRAGGMTALSGETDSHLGSIVFLSYRHRAPLTVEPLAKAEAALELMGCLINARNLPDQGFREVVRLARRVPASRLTYGALGQLEGLFEPPGEIVAHGLPARQG